MRLAFWMLALGVIATVGYATNFGLSVTLISDFLKRLSNLQHTLLYKLL